MPSYSRLLIASAKGGVGKSTTAVELAVSFAGRDKSVLLVDLDITSRSLELMLGAEEVSVRDFSDIIEGRSIESVSVSPLADYPKLSLISATTIERLEHLAQKRGVETDRLISDAVREIMKESAADIIICDTGGELGVPKELVELFDMVLITSEQSITSIRAAEYAASRLQRAGAKHMRLVICSFDLNAVRREKRAGVVEMIDKSALACVGVVPYDKRLVGLQDKGMIPPKSSVSAIAYRNIAGRLAGDEIPLFKGIGRLHRKRITAL